jgi:hypothetical protein
MIKKTSVKYYSVSECQYCGFFEQWETNMNEPFSILDISYESKRMLTYEELKEAVDEGHIRITVTPKTCEKCEKYYLDVDDKDKTAQQLLNDL